MITKPVVDGPPPYVGARPFGIADDEIFFGRSGEIAQVSRLWREHPLTVLHGPAGTGKTSLLCAGAIPCLRGDGAHVLDPGHVWRRNAYPTAAFPEQNLFSFALLSSWYPNETPAEIAAPSILSFLQRDGRKDRFGHAVPILAAIDQAELLFRESLPHGPQRVRLLDQLVDALAAEPRLRLLLSVRDEFLHEALAFARRLDGAEFATFALGPLDRDAAIDAVRRPLARRRPSGAGEDEAAGPPGTGEGEDRVEAVERLVDELRTVRTPWARRAYTVPSVEPALLQPVCARLWADRPAGAPADRLSAEVDRILAEFCEQALVTAAADHGASRGEVVAWFRDVFVEQASGGISAEEIAAALPGAMLRSVEDLHLVRVRDHPDGRRYEVLHSRLITPLRKLRARPGPPRRPGPPMRLRAAEKALCEGAVTLARHHAESVIRACGEGERTRAEAERLLGNICHEQGEALEGVKHYLDAAETFWFLQDTGAVAYLLTAVGRLTAQTDPSDAIAKLTAAATLLPNDRAVHTALGQALRQAGAAKAALSEFDGVLARDGRTLEAVRVRGEILADLDEAEPPPRVPHLPEPGHAPSPVASDALGDAAGTEGN